MTKQLPAERSFLWCFGLLVCLVGSLLPAYAAEPQGETHLITLKAANLPSGQLAYQMLAHKIKSKDGKIRDVTDRYEQVPTVPGPTIVLTEGDVAEVTLEHGIEGSQLPVSVHVHGVHYKIEDDGTIKAMNKTVDSAAFPGKPYTYRWEAAPGTAGTWPYHDHTFGNPMLGSEDKGLYGAVIVNPKSGKVPALIDGEIVDVKLSDVKREFVLWMHETTFWGAEINHLLDGRQIPLWSNPTVGARLGELIRFHVIGMGTAFHTFHLHVIVGSNREPAAWSMLSISALYTVSPSWSKRVRASGRVRGTITAMYCNTCKAG